MLNMYSEYKNKIKEINDKCAKSLNIKNQHQLITKLNNLNESFDNKEITDNYKRKSILLKQFTFQDKTKINIDEIYKITSEKKNEITNLNLRRLLNKYGLDKIIYQDNNSNTFEKRENVLCQDNLNINSDIAPINNETKNLSDKTLLTNLFSDLDNILTEKDKEISFLKNVTNSINEGLSTNRDSEIDILNLKVDLEIENFKYEENLIEINNEREKIKEILRRNYKDKLEKLYYIKRFLLLENIQLKKEIIYKTSMFNERNILFSKRYENNLSILKKYLENINSENEDQTNLNLIIKVIKSIDFLIESIYQNSSSSNLNNNIIGDLCQNIHYQGKLKNENDLPYLKETFSDMNCLKYEKIEDIITDFYIKNSNHKEEEPNLSNKIKNKEKSSDLPYKNEENRNNEYKIDIFQSENKKLWQEKVNLTEKLKNIENITAYNIQIKNLQAEIDSLKNTIKDLNSSIDQYRKETASKENIDFSNKSCEFHNYSMDNPVILITNSSLSKSFADNKIDVIDENFYRNESFDYYNNEEKNKESNEKLSNFAYNIFIEYLFLVYLQKNSISLSHLNSAMLNKFSFYMKSIFIETPKLHDKSNYYMAPVSIIQEHLEDIFLRINNEYINKNLEKLKQTKENLIDSKDLDSEFLLKLSEDIVKSNIISNQMKLYCSHSDSQFNNEFYPDIKTMIAKILNEKISKINNNSVKLKFQENNIKNDLQNKINIYSKKVLEDTLKVAQYCKKYISKGNLNYKNKQLYKFNQTSMITNHRELIIEEHLDISHQLDTIETKLKYNSKELQILSIRECFKNFPYQINRFSSLIINYCRDLIRLTLTDNHFTDTQFFSICRIITFKKIVSLDLSRNNLKDLNIFDLCVVIENHNHLNWLDLTNNLITSKGLIKLSKALQTNTKLESLIIANNSIDQIGLNHLADTLMSKNKTIHNLSIANNQYLIECTSINKLIINCKEIKCLNLSSIIYEKDKDYMEISDALGKNNTLKTLFMEKCLLNSDRLNNLLNCFNHVHLTELHLNNNKLTENDARCISKMLEHNTSLKFISMKNCDLTTPLLIKIITKLNNNVEKLDVRNNSFSLKREIVSTLINATLCKNTYILLNINDIDIIELFSKSDKFIIY